MEQRRPSRLKLLQTELSKGMKPEQKWKLLVLDERHLRAAFEAVTVRNTESGDLRMTPCQRNRKR